MDRKKGLGDWTKNYKVPYNSPVEERKYLKREETQGRKEEEKAQGEWVPTEAWKKYYRRPTNPTPDMEKKDEKK